MAKGEGRARHRSERRPERKVRARLRHEGVRTSKERVRRFVGKAVHRTVVRSSSLREHQLSADTGRATPRGVSHLSRHRSERRWRTIHDGTILPEAVDQMWGTDMTATVTVQHGQVAVFVAVDHCSAECLRLHAARGGTRHEALEPVRQGVRARFGAIGKDVAAGLSLRHDHGSQYMAHDFQNGIRWLGISSSPAFIRAPEGNGCAERVRHGARTGGALMAHSGRSRRPCSGSGPSRPSRSSARRCSRSAKPTTSTG